MAMLAITGKPVMLLILKEKVLIIKSKNDLLVIKDDYNKININDNSCFYAACKKGVGESGYQCRHWASRGYCKPSSRHYGYMIFNCQTACNFCVGKILNRSTNVIFTKNIYG